MNLFFTRSRRPGFTLVELLVAISVLSLMILLAGRVFLDVRRLVSRGMESSQIIASERAISDPLLKDARSMRVAETGLGGESPGFLVIVQDLVVPTPSTDANPTGVRFPEPRGQNGRQETWDTNQRNAADFDSNLGSRIVGAVRSDQLVFFRDASGLDSLTPGFDDDPTSFARATTARIWYGHTSPAAGSGNSLNIGQADAAANQANDVASDLVLGRQALLLVEDNNSTVFPNGRLGSTMEGTLIEGRVALSTGAPLDEVLSEGLSDVFSLADGYRPAITPSGPTPAGPIRLYDDNGSPSVGSAQTLFRSPGWQDPTTLAGTTSYFDALLTPAVPTTPLANPDGSFPGQVIEWEPESRLPTADYAAAALEWAFARPGHRLQADVFVRDDFSAGILTADDQARLHAAFVPHVADFAVDFAADFIDDLSIDPVTGEITPGDDGFPDLEPDRDGFGNIRWYTGLTGRLNPDNNNDGIGDVDNTFPVTYDGTVNVAAFNGSIGGGTIPNPFVYRINGATGAPLDTFAPPAGTERVVFVFGHSGEDPGTSASLGPDEADIIEGSGKYWPYLLRIRYRLMDGSGRFRSVDPVTGEPIVGRWFEQIIPVPRPTGTF